MPPWLGRRWYDVVFWSSFLGFTFGHSIRIAGRRNVPWTGPALLVSNHQSYLDPVLVGLASRRYLSYLARSSLFKNRYLKALIESLDAIPIDRDLGKDGLRATLDTLDRGKAILVFPEGERTHDGEMSPFKPGISLLVKRVTAPIIPVGIVGAFGAWSRHTKLPRFSPLFLRANDAAIAISIGKPLDPAPFARMSRDEILAKLHDAVAAEFAKAKKLQRKPRTGGETL
jgi:1-acyl-sn-glycerol-3-phosphate acyltransferase